MPAEMRFALMLLACSACLASSAATEAALIQPVAQERTVSANAGSPDGSDSDADSASDFGPFDANVSAEVSGSSGDYTATASQLSVILDDQVIGEGAATGRSVGTFPGGDGHSQFSLTFDLFQPVDYQLEFFLRAFSSVGDRSEAFGFLELSGGSDDETILRFDVNGEDPQLAAGPVAGTLAAGRYQLAAGTDVFPAAFSTAEGSFDFEFTVVPEPATALLLAGGLLAFGLGRPVL